MNTHLHKPNWHMIAIRMEHLIHDPRFWAAVALGVLFALMIVSLMYAPTKSMLMPTPMGPIYPGLP